MAEPTPTDQVWVGDLPEVFTEDQIKTTFSNYGEIKWLKALPKPGQKSCALIQFDGVTDAQWAVENLNGNIPEGLTEPVQVKFSQANTKGKGKGKEGKGGKDGKDAGKSSWSGGKEGSGKKGGWSSSDDSTGYGKAGGKAANGKGSWGQQEDAAPGPYSDGKGGKTGKGKSVMLGVIRAAMKGGLVPVHPKPDENCVYVRGLPSDCSDRDLYELFAPFGAIQTQGVKAQQKGGTCSGVGFIDFTETSACTTAIEKLQGLDNGEGGKLELKQKSPSTKGKGKGKDKGQDKGKGKQVPPPWGKGSGAEAEAPAEASTEASAEASADSWSSDSWNGSWGGAKQSW